VSVSVTAELCDRTRSQVSLDLDGELSMLEQVLVSRHLERCPSCRSFSDDVARFTKSLRDAPLEKPGRLVFVPRLRRSFVHDVRTVTVRAGATAAGIAAVLMLALGSNAVPGSDSLGGASSSASAYSESMDYELSLIAQERDRSNGLHMTVAV
jgi:predicted anti-sigma-YlaC factor YlaD